MARVCLEIGEIAVVDADQARSDAVGSLGVLSIIHLGQNIQSQPQRQPVQCFERFVIQSAHYQQYRVRTHGAALVNLIRRDYEILAQDRHAGRFARKLEVFGRPFEKSGVGQYRQRGCAAAGISPRRRGGVKAESDVTPRRRGALEFRYHAHTRRFKRDGEAARAVTARGGKLFDLGLRNPRLRGGNFRALRGQNVIEN